MRLKFKKRKGAAFIATTLFLITAIAFLAFVLDVGIILSVRNTVKNNLELAGLTACTNDLDIEYLREYGKYRLKNTDLYGKVINPFNTSEIPTMQDNPAEYDVCTIFNKSVSGLSSLMDTNKGQLEIYVYPEGSDTPPDWGQTHRVMLNEPRSYLLSVRQHSGDHTASPEIFEPIVPGNYHYAAIFMKYTGVVYPTFLPVIGIGKNGIPFTVKVITETKPFNPDLNK